MNIKKTLGLIVSHGLALALGFAAGVYALPILIAPESPTADQVTAVAERSVFTGRFVRDLAGSDALHWGEGEVFIGPDSISFMGELAPGPDYRLYLAPAFVETEAQFNQLKAAMVEVGDVKTFSNFLLAVPAGINPADYSTVIVWCETFGEFITAAEYQP